MKKIFKSYVFILFFFLLHLPSSWGFVPFKLNEVEVRGLQRIKYGTVLNYMSIDVGDRIDEAKVQLIVRTLYKTGFFSNVNVFKSGQKLVVSVKEKPTIAGIAIVGNSMIPSDQMDLVFRQFDLVAGQVFDEAVFVRIKEELEKQYAMQGHYGAHISVKKKVIENNRIKIFVDIYEGAPARIREITFSGNQHFSAMRLRSQMILKEMNIWNWFFNQDRYAREKFEASLEALRSFYMDRGYIHMKIERQKVFISKDKKYVYIKIAINEGEQFHFGQYRLVGQLPLKQSRLSPAILFKPGDVFSRKCLNDTVKLLTDQFGEFGYIPSIDAEPVINEATHEVDIRFNVRLGPRIYVNRIKFSGNDKTADYVLRYALKQHEAERFSVRHVRESERQLRLLEYFEEVSTETQSVAGTNNQVDLLFKVKEKPAAKATLAAGYAAHSGFQFSASVNQPNFMGSGRTVGFSFNTNNTGKSYSMNYYNPYYYSNRIGRGYSFAYNKTRLGRRNGIQNYHANNLRLGEYYAIKLSDYSSLQLGGVLEHLSVPSYKTSDVAEYRLFRTRNGDRFNALKLTSAWIYNSYNQYPYPTRGWHHSLQLLAAVPPNSHGLAYYKAHFQGQGYYPLPKEFIFTGGVSLGYANGFSGNDFPIYENFIAGGLGFAGQVRGFESGSLGPKSTIDNRLANAIGGNALVSGNIGLVLPYPISQPSLRTAVFLDFGNVYSRGQAKEISGKHGGPLRLSSGLSFNWRSPFGPMAISVAKPINKQDNDRTRVVDFTVSTDF